jgi:hypothetical protein
MEGVTSFYEHLHNLRSQAAKLIDARLGLNALFAEEDTRLQREDAASILRAVHDTVTEKLEGLRRSEVSAGYEHTRTNAVSYVIGLVGEAIVSSDNRASALKDYIIRKATEKKQPFGLVMVCIGPKGLPDDAEVISISQLARDSNRLEPEIVNGLHANGHLLFTEEAFSLLVDRLVVDVHEGKLSLPVSRDKLAHMTGLNRPNSSIRIVPIP